jgi:hypothetical protein
MADDENESSAGTGAAESSAAESTTSKDANGQRAEESAAGGGSPPSGSEQADPPAATGTAKQGGKTAPPAKPVPITEVIAGNPALAHLADVDGAKKSKKDAAVAAKPPADGKSKDGKPDVAKPAANQEEPPKDGAAWAKMRTEHKALAEEKAKLTKQLEDIKEEADFGSNMTKLLTSAEVYEDFKVVDDAQLTDAIGVRASVNRVAHALNSNTAPSQADVTRVSRALAELSKVAGPLGLLPKAPVAAKPFEGRLPRVWEDRIELMGMDEADARRLHGLELAATAAPAKAAETVIPPVAAPPAAAARRELPAVRRAVDPVDEYHRNETRMEVAKLQGIAPEAVAEHYRSALLPIILTDLIAPLLKGNVKATDVYAKLSSSDHKGLTLRAQALYSERQKAATKEKEKGTGSTEKKPLFSRHLPRSHRGHQPVAGSGNDALSFLAGEPVSIPTR